MKKSDEDDGGKRSCFVDNESGNAKTGNYDAALSKRTVNNEEEEELGAQ